MKNYFREELEALRTQAGVFSREHPAIARALGLSDGEARDPQVELLIQAFAFLTGRLRNGMEAYRAVLPNSLLACLYPHLDSPLPSMLVAHLAVKPDGANFAAGVTLERGHQFSAQALDAQGNPVQLRFRSTAPTSLWPLKVTDLQLLPCEASEYPGAPPGVNTALKVTISGDGADRIDTYQPRTLRLFLNSAKHKATALYDLLALDLQAVMLKFDGSVRKVGDADCLHWRGFDDDEAALPTGVATHPGHRLLQEYFAFHEKFLFFDVNGLDLSGAGSSFELVFLMRTALRKLWVPERAMLQLNCVPLVNLFSTRIDPITLDHTRLEYPLSAESHEQGSCEIVQVEHLQASRPGVSPRTLRPYFALSEESQIEGQDYFYLTRREVSRSSTQPGTNSFVSFVDLQFNTLAPADEVVGGRALCSNRRLPDQLRIGSSLQMHVSGPVGSVTVLTRPTQHQTPVLNGAQPWALVSQLTLNHLSLAGGAKALSALRSVLRLHLGRNVAIGANQINSLAELDAWPIARRMGSDGWRGPVRGIHLRLHFDRDRFEGGSPLLLASVLRYFFGLYAHVNTVTEVSAVTTDRPGFVKQWPPLSGTLAAV